MGEVIVVTSGKGGVGKTTTTANLGTALAALKKRVIVIDGDTGLRNLDVLMGLENRIVFNILDVIEERCLLRKALIKDKRFDNLYLLPTAQCRDKCDINAEDMLKITNELKVDFDYILIDCPAGIEQGFENSIAGANRAVIVVNPEITSIRDADRVIGKLDSKGISDHKVIINRLNYEMTKNGDMLGVNDIIDCLAVKLLGVVPEDKCVTVSTNKGEPIVLNNEANAGIAFMNIAKRICGEEVPLQNFEDGKEGFWSSIKKIFRGK